jgi:hypothetical protein
MKSSKQIDRTHRRCACMLGRIAIRYTAILLSTLVLLAASACKTGQHANSRRTVTDTGSGEVPLPASTPFDGTSQARAAYLQGYREGYCSGFPGFVAPPWVRVGIFDTTEPRTRGWTDGACAARLDAAMRIRKEQ